MNPVSCQRLPSKSSFTSKCVENVSKLSGAHNQKNCGSATGAPVGARSPTPRTPHDRSRRAERLAGCEVVQHAVDLDPTLPPAELGEACVVERDSEPDLLEEVWLLDGGRSTHEGQVRSQPLLGRVDRDPKRVERLEHFDPDRADLVRVGTVGWGPTRRMHADLSCGRGATICDHAERGVDDMAVRVQPHRRGEEQTGVPGVAVEEVAVVVVDVAGRRLGDRAGGLMDRKVVERTQHPADASHIIEQVWNMRAPPAHE